MIDEKKFMEYIRDEYHGGYSEKQIAPYELDRMIEEFPKENTWIPVKERLPEKRGNCLCTMVMNGTPDTFIMIGHYNGEDHSKLMPQWADDNKMHRTIAWMPLPEPWEGGK